MVLFAQQRAVREGQHNVAAAQLLAISTATGRARALVWRPANLCREQQDGKSATVRQLAYSVRVLVAQHGNGVA